MFKMSILNIINNKALRICINIPSCIATQMLLEAVNTIPLFDQLIVLNQKHLKKNTILLDPKVHN